MKKLAYLLHLSILLVSCGSGNSVAVDSGQVTVIVDSAIWFENAVKADPTNFTLLLEKSKNLHLRRSEVDAAQTDLEKYLSLDSSNLDVQKLYADILLSKLVLDKSKYHYEYIIERDYVCTCLSRNRQNLRQSQNNAAAIAYLNKSLTIPPISV